MRDTAERQSGRWPQASSLLWPYLALVLLHVLSGLEMEQPLILADELGYLGNARYLSGAADLPSMQGRVFYHFGYSILLLPAFWLFSEPTSIYRAAIVINSLLAGALFFPLRYILTSFVRVPETMARWIAFASCLYPSLLLYSSFAWSESAYVPFYAAAAALFGRYLTSKSTRDLVLFCLVSGYLYTIHPRALPVVAVVLIYLLLLTAIRVLPLRRFSLGASTMIAVVLVTRLVNDHLKATGWAGGGETYATKLPGRLLPGPDSFALLERVSGQLVYLSLATHGLFLLGLIAMLSAVVGVARSESLRRALASPRAGVPLFILTTAGGVLATSSVLKLYSLHGVNGLRGGNFIHGRYNEAFAVLAILYGLAELCRAGLGKRQVAWRVLVVVAVMLVLTTVVMVEIDDALSRQVADQPGVQPRGEIPATRVDTIAVPGVAPMVEIRGGLNLYPIALAVIGSFLVVVVTTRSRWRAGLAVVMLLFLSFAYYNRHHYQNPLAKRSEHRLDFASHIRRLDPNATISFDAASPQRRLKASLQYLLPHSTFLRFDSTRGEAPESDAVISTDDWAQAGDLGARFVVSTGRGSALWVLPGTMQSHAPPFDYEGVNLGSARHLEVREKGFHQPETFLGRPGRWTDGAASLEVWLDPARPPRALIIATLVPELQGPRLGILANGVELWNKEVPSDPWTRTFDLRDVPIAESLVIELLSDATSPSDIQPGSTDQRRLGVVVTGIRLTGSHAAED